MNNPSRPKLSSPPLSDRELLNLCETYGRETLVARRKFAGLLPEVARRHLYLKKNCSSLYMFAALLAGMSHQQVDVVLRLEKRFQNKAILRQALVGGEVSVNKLVRIIPLITDQNQQELLNTIKKLSNRALEIFVREQKIANTSGSGSSAVNASTSTNATKATSASPATPSPSPQTNADRRPSSHIPPQTLHVQTLSLAPDVEKELEEIQNKGIDINQLLREMLQLRRAQINTRKAEFDAQERQKSADLAVISKPTSRYIPRKIVRLIKAEFGNKCSRPGCTKIAAHIHHQRPFAKYGTHSPYYLEPLCLGHHELAHADNQLIRKFKIKLSSVQSPSTAG